MTKALWVILFCLLSATAFAKDDTYYDERAEGWHWYDDPADEVVETKTPQAEQTPSVSATDEMKALQKILEETKNKAVLYPTEENIANYVMIQNQIMNHSRDFAKGWQAMLVNSPDLNYQVSHPTNQVGRQVYLDEKSETQDKSIHEFFKDKGLYFFFRSTCPYCHVLRQF